MPPLGAGGRSRTGPGRAAREGTCLSSTREAVGGPGAGAEQAQLRLRLLELGDALGEPADSLPVDQVGRTQQLTGSAPRVLLTGAREGLERRVHVVRHLGIAHPGTQIVRATRGRL